MPLNGERGAEHPEVLHANSIERETTVYMNHRVALIIPALNEEGTIGPLLSRVDRELVDTVLVVTTD